jgi:hypothetical protein
VDDETVGEALAVHGHDPYVVEGVRGGDVRREVGARRQQDPPTAGLLDHHIGYGTEG